MRTLGPLFSELHDNVYVLARGVLLHPRHMWFIAHAHAQGDIDRMLEIARGSLLDAKRALL